MRIATIGGTSFTGRAFCAAARSAGHEVIDFSRPFFDLRGNLPEAIGRHVVVSGTKVVVNFAALNMVGESWEHASDYYSTNVAALAEVADHLIGTDLDAFVQVSTPEVFGLGAMGARVHSEAGHAPSTPYALSRSAAEKHLMLIAKERRFPVRITRTVNVYGVGQQLYRLIPKLAIYATQGWRFPLHGGGTSERSFIHVDDVARGIITVIERGRNGAAYHMASDALRTIRSVAEKVCRLCGREPSEVLDVVADRPGKDPAYLLDDRETRALGWLDTVAFDRGLEAAVEWAAQIASMVTVEETAYKHRR